MSKSFIDNKNKLICCKITNKCNNLIQYDNLHNECEKHHTQNKYCKSTCKKSKKYRHKSKKYKHKSKKCRYESKKKDEDVCHITKKTLKFDKPLNLELKVECVCDDIINYKFELAMPQLLRLCNECCNLNVSIIIPICFEIDCSLFRVHDVEMQYQNLEIHKDIQTSAVKCNKGYYIVPIETSHEMKCNILCIETFIIKVLPKSFTNNCEHSANIGELVYTDNNECLVK